MAGMEKEGKKAAPSKSAESIESMTQRFQQIVTEIAGIQKGRKEISQLKADEKKPLSRLYTKAALLAKKISDETGFEARTEVLGRLQRGGEPCAHDRILSARLSAEAVRCIIEEEGSKVVGMKNNQVISYPIQEAIKMVHEHTHGLRHLIDMLQ